jgi:hypothetical protein
MRLKVLCPRRVRLGVKVGQRITVLATYLRMGSRHVGRREFLTVLLGDVRDADTGNLLADHVWFNRGNIWRQAGLRPGDVVRFQTRPIEYRTGYWGPNLVRQLESPARFEYRLTTPEGLEIVRPERCGRGEAA